MDRRADAPEVSTWQHLTRRANRCLALRQYAAARQLYREALWEAERLLTQATQHSEAPAAGWDALLAAWVVAHHNMADLIFPPTCPWRPDQARRHQAALAC